MQWLDEENDLIQMTSDSEVVEAIEIAKKGDAELVIEGPWLFMHAYVLPFRVSSLRDNSGSS